MPPLGYNPREISLAHGMEGELAFDVTMEPASASPDIEIVPNVSIMPDLRKVLLEAQKPTGRHMRSWSIETMIQLPPTPGQARVRVRLRGKNYCTLDDLEHEVWPLLRRFQVSLQDFL